MPALQTPLAQKFPYHFLHIAVLTVDRVVEPAHVVVRNPSCKFIQRLSHLRMAAQHPRPDDGDGLVGREVVAVVFENDHAQGRDQAVGGIAGDDVNLFFFQCAVEQARGP